MKKRRLRLRILYLVFLLPLFIVSSHADMGPKPSVRVAIQMEDSRPCWGTLLSEKSSTGPYSALSFGAGHTPRVKEGEPDYLAWQAFQNLSQTDPDGYYFLQYLDECSDGSFYWGYYPPARFKVALWFPEENAFVISQPVERYAFDSHYILQFKPDMVAGLEQGENISGAPLRRSYPVATELAAFLVRAALTFGVELLVALLFRLCRPNLWKMLLGVNLTTQLLLNVGLNIYLYFCGSFILMLFLVYALAELAVVAVELTAYRLLLAGEESPVRKKLFWYTWAANLASFGFGLFLSQSAPVLF